MVGRLAVGAETIAEIMGKLVDPLSYKTLVFGLVALLSVLYIMVSGFRNYSSSSAFDYHAHPTRETTIEKKQYAKQETSMTRY